MKLVKHTTIGNVAPTLPQKIIEIVNPILSFHSLALVDTHGIRKNGMCQIRLVLYRSSGFDISELEDLHKILYSRLTVLLDEQNISLELSSPGIDYVFKRDIDYDIFSGREVKILVMPHNCWHNGTLLGKKNNCVLLKTCNAAIEEHDCNSVVSTKLNSEVRI